MYKVRIKLGLIFAMVFTARMFLLLRLVECQQQSNITINSCKIAGKLFLLYLKNLSLLPRSFNVSGGHMTLYLVNKVH